MASTRRSRPDPTRTTRSEVRPSRLRSPSTTLSLEAKLRSSGQIQNHLLAVAVFTSALMAWRMVFAIALQVHEGAFEELLPALMFMMPLTVLPIFIVFVHGVPRPAARARAVRGAVVRDARARRRRPPRLGRADRRRRAGAARLPADLAAREPVLGGAIIALVPHVAHLGPLAKLLSLTLPLVNHAIAPMYHSISPAEELQLLASAFTVGCTLGYIVERTARGTFVQEIERRRLEVALATRESLDLQHRAEAQSAALRAEAHRVINHTSKRVMLNAVQACEVVGRRLSQQGFADGAAAEMGGRDVYSLLSQTQAETVAGFHMCRSVLLRARLVSGEYLVQSEEFSVGQLFASLGLNSNPRFVCAADGHVTVRADKLLLETILFNAAQNALHHGAAGGRVHANAQVIAAVPASDHPPTLRISLRNEAGSNHAALLALSETTPNLLHASTDELVGANTMTAASLGSTFLGLRDINQGHHRVLAARPGVAHRRRDLGHVRARRRGGDRPGDAAAAAARRQRRGRSGVGGVEDGGERGAASAAGSPPSSRLPKGLTWVCCDDDELPRFFLEALVKKAEGAADSLVGGGNYGELEALPATIARLASEHGDEGVVVVLDENLELYGHPRIKGSEMCKQLRDVHNFGGVVVSTRRTTRTSRRRWPSPPAPTASPANVGKGLQMLHDTIAKWYERRLGRLIQAVTRRRLLIGSGEVRVWSLTPDGERSVCGAHVCMHLELLCSET